MRDMEVPEVREPISRAVTPVPVGGFSIPPASTLESSQHRRHGIARGSVVPILVPRRGDQ